MTATIETAPAVVTFTADRKQLLAAATWAAKGLPRRPAVPVLAGMLVTVADGTVTLAGFDYDLTARASVPAIGYFTRPADSRDGAVLVRGRDLVAAVKGMPSGKDARVSAEVNGRSLVVTSGGVTGAAELLPIEDYPELPTMPPAAGVMASDAFREAVGRVAVAACRDDTLPVLCAVNMVTSASEITVTATDRYRAAFDAIPWTPADLADAADYPWNLNVPTVAAVAFAKAASKGGKVTLHIGEAQLPTAENHQQSIPPMIGFSDGERELITRTVDAEFPKMWERLIKEIHGIAEVDGPALAAAVKRAGEACERDAPVHLWVMRDGITVTAWRDGEQSYRQTVPGSSESDQTDDTGRKVSGWRCAYNPEYLHSLLAGVAGTVRLSWDTLTRPMQVTSAGDDSSYRAIVMPVRIPSPR